MKIGIMQPYFFPYIGYFQLINAVDKFVIYDDVNYIKQGWINRNRILLNGKDHLFTLNLVGASSFKLINEIEISNNINKLLKTIYQEYSKAPFFIKSFPIIEDIFTFNDTNLGRFLENSIRRLCDYFHINTEILVSSKIEKQQKLEGQEKIIDICKRLNANEYINAIGGQELYSKNIFNQNEIKLSFIKSKPTEYKQFNNEFVSWLSIIDLMMFNSPEQISQMLDQYELL